MSRRGRRAGSMDDSLDLLLDTICNTFGGLIFLALLLCLSVRDAVENGVSESATEHRAGLQVDLIESGTAAAVAEGEARRLEGQLAGARGVLQTLSGHSDPDKASEWMSLIIRWIQLKDESGKLDAQIASGIAAVADAQEANDGAKARVVAAGEKEAATRVQAGEITAAKRISVRLPREQVTFKREVSLFLAHGNVHQTDRYDALGGIAGVNRREVDVLSLEDPVTKRNLRNGTPVPDEAAAAAIVQARLAIFDTDVAYILLIVWPDSHAEARRLRDAVIAAGYDYQLLLITDAGSIERSSGDRTVQ